MGQREMAVKTADVESKPVDVKLEPSRKVNGVYRPPADKSIAHRALLLAALAEGRSTVAPVSQARDVAATVTCLRQLGVNIEESDGVWVVDSPGAAGWLAPERSLDCANSGTTMRLLAGCLAGGDLAVTLAGDASLSRRPMERIAEPLRRMGAEIQLSLRQTAPIRMRGSLLRGIDYELPVPSAQVKSALLLAGLRAAGDMTIIEHVPSRDHTERMLSACGVDCSVSLPARPSGDWRERALAGDEDDEKDTVHRRTIRLGTQRIVRPHDWVIPGDFSAAAYFLAAAVGASRGDLIVQGVGLNPTRTGLLRVLSRMGAHIELKRSDDVGPEPCGQIRAHATPTLKAVKVGPHEIPSLIDELPLVAILAARAEGVTVVRGASELRHKESDRIAAVTANLRAMGVKVAELEDGWAIEGPTEWRGTEVDSYGDHRVAMAFAITALWADAPTVIRNAGVMAVSDPDFLANLIALVQ